MVFGWEADGLVKGHSPIQSQASKMCKTIQWKHSKKFNLAWHEKSIYVNSHALWTDWQCFHKDFWWWWGGGQLVIFSIQLHVAEPAYICTWEWNLSSPVFVSSGCSQKRPWEGQLFMQSPLYSFQMPTWLKVCRRTGLDYKEVWASTPTANTPTGTTAVYKY